MTPEEEARLMLQLTGRQEYSRPIAVLAVNAGLRESELLNLKKRDTDIERGLINVSNTKSGKDISDSTWGNGCYCGNMARSGG